MINKIILVASAWFFIHLTFYADTIEMVPKPFPAGYEPLVVNKTGTVNTPTNDSKKVQRIVINNNTNQTITALITHQHPAGKLRDTVSIAPGSQREITKAMDVWFEHKMIKEGVIQSIQKQGFPNGISFNGSEMYRLNPENNTFTITEGPGGLRVEQE